MKKSIMLLAAGLTGFILAGLAGVIYTRNAMAISQPISQSSVSSSVPSASVEVAPAPAVAAVLPTVSPQDAAALAAKGINRTDLYSVEIANFQGNQVYKVAFSSGDIAYVSLTGQLLGTVAAVASITTPPPTGSLYPAVKPLGLHKRGGGGSNKHGGGGGGGGDDGGGDH